MRTIHFFLFATLSFLGPHNAQADPCLKTRGMLDIGSGSTKMKVAQVNVCEQKIIRILSSDAAKVAYAADLKAQKETTVKARFSEDVLATGLTAMLQLVQEGEAAAVREHSPVDEWRGIATSAFRNAENGEESLERLSRALGFHLELISQDTEGKLGYIAGIQVASVKGKALSHVVVWDIGGGSQQFSYRDGNALKVIKLEDQASEKFKFLVIHDVEKNNSTDAKTPNPIGVENITQASRIAESFAQAVILPFVPSEVIGIGGVHSTAIPKVIGAVNEFTSEILAKAATENASKTDAELKDKYADTAVSNLILVSGMMKRLGIDCVHISPYSTTDGALIYPELWK